MMSSIKGSPEDEALVRRLGGDLFLTKFEIMDMGRPGQAFSRHVRALVLSRRQPPSDNMPEPQQHGGQVHHDGLELDRTNHSVRFNGKSCKLPDGLFDLFCSLASSQSHPLEHGQPDGRDRELDVQVSRLRARLEEAFGRDLLDKEPPRR
jgi:DNA-binding response OmpR family regulator